jgi:transglutaminase-like putative cysteine protease
MNKMNIKLSKSAGLIDSSGYQGWARLKSWPLWVGLLLWSGLACLTILSFQIIHWTNPQPAYIAVLWVAIVLATINVLVARSVWLILVTSVVGGLLISIWQTVILFPAPDGYSVAGATGYSFSHWANALFQASPSENNLYFSLFLVIITWVWGYLGTWRLLKYYSIWPAAFVGLVIILVNLAFLKSSYYGYFYTFLLLAILLISYVYFMRYNLRNGYFPKLASRSPLWMVGLTVLFSGILVLMILWSPQIRADQLRRMIETRTKQSNSFEDIQINIFKSVSSKETIVKNTDQDLLRFSNHPNLSNNVQFLITSSDVPNYWRVRRYDIYNHWGWSTSTYQDEFQNIGQSLTPSETAAIRKVISYTVQDKIRTDVILSSGRFLTANVPSILHVFPPVDADQVTGPQDDLVSVSAPHIYQVDERYTVKSEIIKPAVEQLQKAGNVVPDSIKQQYLQLPSDMSQDVNRLARTLTRGITSNYQKVMAVSNYLAKFNYVLDGTYPPDNSDAVQNFLFDQQSGNCTNFTSAAVVLLRSAGVPARFCTGYIPHFVDKNANSFVVLAKDYHAWPEVYFPGYGWIEFEVTPGSTTEVASDNTPENSLGLSDVDFNDFPLYSPITTTPSPALPTDNPANQTDQPGLSAARSTMYVLLVLLVASLILYTTWSIRMRRKDYISGVMAKLQVFSPLIGVRFYPHQTSQEYANALMARLPFYQHQIEKITQIYQISRYSRGKMILLKDEKEIKNSWSMLQRGIIWRIIWRF